MGIQAAISSMLPFLSADKSAFGENLNVTPHPVAGWKFTYNVNTDMVIATTTGSGTVTTSNGKAQLSTGGAISSSAKIETRRFLPYTPGQANFLRMTAIFGTPVDGNTQKIFIGTDTDGYFFGYDGTTFQVGRRFNGTDYPIAQANWNNNIMPNFNPQLLNVFYIGFQWLGGGGFVFGIEDPRTSQFSIVHIEPYANTATDTSILNPTLPVMAYVENDADTSDTVILQTPSAMAFVAGPLLEPVPNHPLAFTRGFDFSVTVPATTETYLCTIREVDPYQSIENRILAQLELLSLATDGAQAVRFRLYKNVDISGDTPNWVSFDLDVSGLQIDTDATTTDFSSGQFICAFPMGIDATQVIDVNKLGILVTRNDTLTLTAQSAGAVTNASEVSLTFLEQF